MSRREWEPMHIHSRWTDKAYWRQVRYWIATDAKGVKPGRYKVISPFAFN